MKPWESPCDRAELACVHALQALPASERTPIQAHIDDCVHCQRELESLRPVVDRFVLWPTDVLRPPTTLQARLSRRIGGESGKPLTQQWSEPDWEQVAPGIECKLLATDGARHRVSMLVRLAPGTRMGVRRVACAGRQAHQHADPMPPAVSRQQLAFDAGRDLFPIGLVPSRRRRRYRCSLDLHGDSLRKTRLQRCWRTQHVGRP